MNRHDSDLSQAPTRAEAEEAIATLARWGSRASAEDRRALGGLPWDPAPLSRSYPEAFAADAAYRDGLPDVQNGPSGALGARRPIQHVGIDNFRLPLRHRTRAGELMLETSVSGTVSLPAGVKGINMSRLMRSFYRHADARMDWAVLDGALDDYVSDHGVTDARLALAFRLPLEVPALRSGLSGWQFYDVVLELWQDAGIRRRVMHLDYVYASTCPCSLELSEHARTMRGQLATPHSQRSVARLSAVLDPAAPPPLIEDLVEMCRREVPTETQVMVRREDEQAFAELSAAHPVFVEDAARLLAEGLMRIEPVGDFRVVCSHQESLHSHDAVSVLTEGPTFAGPVDPHLFGSMVHTR